MNIRLLDPSDATIFRTLRIEAITDTPSAFTESIEEIKKKSDEECADQLRSHGKGDFVLGAFGENDQLLGMVGFFRTAHATQFHKGTLWGMYVSPNGRRQGIGDALISAAIEHAKNLPGIVYITLCVTASNNGARQFYEAKGFQVCGTEQKALCIDGVYFDEMMMQLLLV